MAVYYKHLTINGYKLKVFYRKCTKDERVIKEVLQQPCYEHKRINFIIAPGERWLDLGAHIGCFSLLCLTKGAHTHALEPNTSNYCVLMRNLENTDCTWQHACMSEHASPTIELFTPTSKRDGAIPNTKYSIDPMSSYKPLEKIPNVQFRKQTTKGYHGIKMDIESTEHHILDNLLKRPPHTSVQKMVIEYHFIKNRSMSDFKRRMDNLREVFEIVQYPAHLDRFLDEGLEEYPGYFDRLIHCLHHKG